MSIHCPYCGSPDWEPAPKPYTYVHRGRENAVVWAKCNYCNRYFYLYRTRLETFTLRMEALGPPRRGKPTQSGKKPLNQRYDPEGSHSQDR